MSEITESAPLPINVPSLVRIVLGTLLPVLLSTTVDFAIPFVLD
jgi:hypothetical protein